MTQDPLADLPAHLFERNEEGKFAPKLDHAQRCAIYALYKRGMTKQKLAAVFGLNRRTVSHICNDNSPHYRKVRDTFRQMDSLKGFVGMYVTPDIIEKLKEFDKNATKQAEASLSYTDYDASRSAIPNVTANNRRASGKEGRHYVGNPLDPHGEKGFVIVEWHEASEMTSEDGTVTQRDAGWYAQVENDPVFGDFWHGPYPTSNAALKAGSEQV